MRTILLACLLTFGCSSSESAVGEPVTTDSGTPSASDTSASDTSVIDGATDDTSVPDVATSDSAVPDTARPDTARSEAGKPDVAPGGECNTASECRLFASYCSTAPCRCIPLLKGEPTPKCTGTPVTCLVDPCEGKAAACVDGMCAAK